MTKKFLRFLDSIFTLFIVLILLVLGAYSAYALWDNNQVYATAEDVQDALLSLKPEADADSESVSASFEELLAINSDVCAWLTMDNTEIDYPIVQGESVLSYLNTDVYGNFSLSGSIFLDPANDNDFSDAYSLVYGHHMEKHRMFGDLDLYEEEAFFSENTTGTLILPDRSYRLEVFGCLLVSASEDAIFTPQTWLIDDPETAIGSLLEFVEENAVLIHEDTIALLREDENPQVLALSTCSSDFTDARTVVLARMVPYSVEDNADA